MIRSITLALVGLVLLGAAGSGSADERRSGLVTDVDSDYQVGMPEVQVVPDRNKAADIGISMADIGDTINSAIRFVAPMMLEGLTALSEEIIRKFETRYSQAAFTRFQVPRTLFFTASMTCASIIGTCL